MHCFFGGVLWDVGVDECGDGTLAIPILPFRSDDLGCEMGSKFSVVEVEHGMKDHFKINRGGKDIEVGEFIVFYSGVCMVFEPSEPFHGLLGVIEDV